MQSFLAFFSRKLFFQAASHRTWGLCHMCCEMLDQRNSKFPSMLRFYNGSRKGIRATFSLLPETHSNLKSWLLLAKVRVGREIRLSTWRQQKGEGGAKGSCLWREPSGRLLQIKDWDKQGLMPQVLRYHVIACHQLLLENLKLTPNATSVQGESIVISVSQVKEATSGRGPFSLGLLSSPLT